ncbi:hypothetical protein Tco_0661972 [Tanacetum coccineum]
MELSEVVSHYDESRSGINVRSIFTIADNHPALSEYDHPESAYNLEPAEIQDNVTNEPISDIHHSPSDEDIHLSPVP